MHLDKISHSQTLNYKRISTELKNAKYICISGGKGGVGKSISTISLAYAAAAKGLNVLIVDGDFGLSNINIILGLYAKYSLNDFLKEKCRFLDIVIKGPKNIDLISSGSGIYELQKLSVFEQKYIINSIKMHCESYDLILIDTGAGISENVLLLNEMANKNLIITTPEPHAITDAYALIKVLNQKKKVGNFDLVVNQVISEKQGENVFHQINETSRKFLNIDLRYVGSIASDTYLKNAILAQRIDSEKFVHSIAGQSWFRIASRYLTNSLQ